MNAQNYYQLLDVPPHASLEEIKAAYRQRIKRYHPDHYAGRRARYLAAQDWENVGAIDAKIHHAEEMTRAINSAYRVLSDPRQRRRYNLELAQQQRNSSAAAPGAASHRGGQTRRPYTTTTRGNPAKEYPYGYKRPPSQERSRPSAASTEEELAKSSFKLFLVVQAMAGVLLAIVVGALILGLGARQQSDAAANENRGLSSQGAIGSAPGSTAAPSFLMGTYALEKLPASIEAAPDDAARGDYYYSQQQYAQAVNAYSLALQGEDSALLRYKRAMARLPLLPRGNIPRQQVLDDLLQATQLDPNFAPAHLEAALFAYENWQRNGEAQDQMTALRALKAYLALTGDPAPDLAALLDELQAAPTPQA